MNTDGLYRLGRNDEGKLAALLAECFSKDPLYCQLIPEEKLRNKVLPEIFGCELDEMFQNCEIYADSPEVNGIIVVSDETGPHNPFKYYMSEVAYDLKTAACLVKDDPSLKTLRNFIRGKAYLNSNWADKLPQKRRMHIVYFAVCPTVRGKGVAGKLMRAVLAYADRNRMTTSLETHNQRNVSLYEHFGFRVFETLQKNFELNQFCMVR